MKTHWKQLTNPAYIGAYSLTPGEERTVKIKSVVREMITGEGGKQEECTVAHLEGEKPFILNKTNCKIIAKIYETPYIEEWAGKLIIIYAAKIRAFGEDVEALRIRQRRPEPKKLPGLDPSHPNWDKAVEAARSGQITADQVKTKYTISETNLKTLFDETV